MAVCSLFGDIGIFDVNGHTLENGDGCHWRGRLVCSSVFHPTKNQFLVTGGRNDYTHAMLFDENLNVIHDTPAISYNGKLGVQYVNGVFSIDGSRVYLEYEGSRVVAVLDGDAFNLLGVVQRKDPSRNYLGLYSQAMDENNLLVGASHQGLVVIDPKYITSTPMENDILFPGRVESGPTTGGSQATYAYYPMTQLDNPAITQATVSFDGVLGTSVSSTDGDNGYKTISVTSPPHSNGVVNVGMYFPDNSWVMGASIYSFGPNIRDALTTASTAEGGPAFLTGYGFENGLNVQVGGTSVETTIGASPQSTLYSPDQYTLRTAG